MLAPSLSNWYSQQSFRQEIEAYDQFAGIDCDAMWKAAEAYNRDLAARGDLRTLSEAEEARRTAGLLDPWGTGMMGYLEIPKIDVSLPIYQGTEEAALQAGAGHWQGSSLPVGGPGSHCVLTGHNGLIKAKMFTDLNQLELGDTFTLSVLDRVLTYQVDQILVTDPSDLGPLAIEEGCDYVTLYTCTPYGVNTQRLLVRGSRVEAAAQAPPDVGETGERWIPLAGAALLCTAFLSLRRRRMRKRPARISGRQRENMSSSKLRKEGFRMRKGKR